VGAGHANPGVALEFTGTLPFFTEFGNGGKIHPGIDIYRKALGDIKTAVVHINGIGHDMARKNSDLTGKCRCKKNHNPQYHKKTFSHHCLLYSEEFNSL
jgi:hypothetical protein